MKELDIIRETLKRAKEYNLEVEVIYSMLLCTDSNVFTKSQYALAEWDLLTVSEILGEEPIPVKSNHASEQS